jgi:hypothetical protein
MAATIPADIIQFYYHVIVTAQELAYVYGFNKAEDSQFKEFLTILIGVMNEIPEAEDAFKKLADDEFSGKLGKAALGKMLDKAIVKIAVQISVQLGKRGMLKAVTKAVPLVGGIVSGGVTYFQFKPMCDNLKNKLYDAVEAKRNTKK